jgi:hypothetical protein
LRNRLIGVVGNLLIFLVDQTDVAKHITVEGENSREAIGYSVDEPLDRSPEAIGVQDHLKIPNDTAHKLQYSPRRARSGSSLLRLPETCGARFHYKFV